MGIERHYITLPEDALPPTGTRLSQPLASSGVRFADRHTVQLSSDGVDEQAGTLDWLVVERRVGGWLPSGVGQEERLTERGIFQHGLDTVLLKMPARTVTLNVRLRGNDRLDYLNNRRLLTYLLGWDQATIGRDPFGLPRAWTYTWEQGDGKRYHHDFVLAQPSQGDGDDGNPTHQEMQIGLNLLGDKATWYGDEITQSLTLLDMAIDDPYRYTTNEIVYTGTARGTVRFLLTIDGAFGGEINGVALRNVSRGTVSYFEYAGDGGWAIPAPTGDDKEVVLTLDSAEKLFTLTGAGIDGVDLITAVSQGDAPGVDWATMLLEPGATYQIGWSASSDVRVRAATLAFTPHFAGV